MEAILRREIIVSKSLCRFIGVFCFVIFTALGAFVRIPLPFTPVPLTLQTFFVLLSGAFLGSGFGLAAQLSYVILGVSGFPIFSGSSGGWFYLLGPTGGYLFGFILASFLAGKFIKSCGSNFLSVFAVFCLADLALLLSGVLWLRIIFGFSWAKLLFIGFVPFIFGDLLKAAAAAAIYLRLKPRLKEIF